MKSVACVDDIFLNARELSDPAEREVYLKDACGGDAELLDRVKGMLCDATGADAFFNRVDQGKATASLTELSGVVIGRYKLLQQIGEGGMGVVYMAEQEEPVRRRVALKIIKLGLDSQEVVARFEAERQALALMDHPNIARVLDGGATDTGRPYFVMELVRGVPITVFCDKKRLSARERLKLFIPVCQAIQSAHQKGIIHRDLKPTNILVTLDPDGLGVPKVIDFGVAKAISQKLTEKVLFTSFATMIGTPAYMSPEQAEMSALDIDTRTDIYSLGVLLYELLTGSTPFDTQELAQSGLDGMRKIIREREPVRPSTRLRQATSLKVAPSHLSNLLAISTDLDWIVMKCLEKDRTRRYEAAAGLVADLKRHLNHETVVARPPSTAYRLQKAFYRNKLLFVAAAAVLFALVAGLGLATAGLRRALAAQASEAVQRRQAQEAQAREVQLRRAAEILELAARRRAYASDMNLAQQSVAANNFGRALELLNRYLPATKSETDLRGWEWRYLWQFCQGDDLFMLCRLTNSAFSLSSSRDGRWLAVGEFSPGGVSVWDLLTRREIGRPTVAGWGALNTRVLFSPRVPLLAYTSNSKGGYSIQLWSAATQRAVGTLALGSQCFGLTFSDDGLRLATITGKPNPNVTLWSIPDGQKLGTVPLEGENFVQSAARISTSRDLRFAAYAMPNGRIRVIDLTTGSERWSDKAAREWTMSLTFSPDGKILASSAGYTEGAIKLWDVATGKELGLLEGHQGWVASVLFWPDGKKLASASADQTIRLWDVENPAQPRPVGVLRGHNAEVWDLVLLPDNVTLMSGAKDGSVRAWDTTKEQRIQTAVTFPEKLFHWHFASDDGSLITLDTEGRVTRWKGESFQEPQLVTKIDPSAPLPADFFCLAWDGRRVAKGSTNGMVQVWDLDGRTGPHELSTKPDIVKPLAFLGRDAVILDHQDNSISQWDLSSGRETKLWQPQNSVHAWAVSPDGHWSGGFSFDGAGILQDHSTLTKTNFTLNLREASDARFSPDGKSLAVVSWLGIGKVWSIEPMREIGTLRGFRQGIDSVAFSPDGSRLAAGGSGKEALKLYDTAGYQELLTLEADASGYHDIEFSPDGNVLGLMSGQGVALFWRAPSWEEIAAAEAKEKPQIKQP